MYLHLDLVLYLHLDLVLHLHLELVLYLHLDLDKHITISFDTRVSKTTRTFGTIVVSLLPLFVIAMVSVFSNLFVNCKIDCADCFGKSVSGTPLAAQEGRLQGQGIVIDPVQFCC